MIFQLENKNIFASDSGQGLDKNKDTIVFLHGSGLSHIVWSLAEQFFSSKNFNVLSIDLPGHGNSDGPCLDSIEKIADWLEKVFDKLQLKNLILVGHSQGCLEILEYSSRYKERIKKLVFVGGSNKMPVHPDLIELAQNGHSDAVKLMMKWGYEGSKKFIGGNPVEKIIQSPRDISEILAVDLKACNNYSNGSEAAKAINLPSMLIYGELDKMVNLEAGKKFSNLIKNSITHVIKGCGHMIMIEKAFEMREKILEFLNK
ncbi:alpha/beta fold hydrolase [Candidatus Pelagibacter sp. RS39]|uniref:alpha/beta fold hydrolase n=1 Tax=Candidatus Pelagibacter sp. RS39 TaxID=1977864 RepID=UPI000A14844B|nr:alpha/beta hydrolase [Candidatus Pelagibacter sp. RS39]ARJ48397.1 alpha/beta hydrolase [Candidatus Pelagibacter sp. RS39]